MDGGRNFLEGGSRGGGLEGLADELVLFEEVDSEGAGGGRRGGGATRVAESAFGKILQAESEVGPGSHIFRLFLAPDEFCVGGLGSEEGEEFLFVQGIDLFEAKNGGIANFILFAVVGQIVKDFS